MKLMLRSYSNLLLSVRRVTQENQGKRTAGLDGQRALTPKERVALERVLKGYVSPLVEKHFVLCQQDLSTSLSEKKAMARNRVVV